MAQREIISDRQTDRQDNTILLSCLFTYSSIRTRTARGGHFLQAYHAVQDAALPGGLFAFSQEGKGGNGNGCRCFYEEQAGIWDAFRDTCG